MLLSLAASFMHKLNRDSRMEVCGWIGGREFMTAVAVSRDWRLRFPMTVKARRMVRRTGAKRRGRWHEAVGPPRRRRFWNGVALRVTERAVVVVLRLSVRHHGA